MPITIMPPMRAGDGRDMFRGVGLAGGRSSRTGSDKACLPRRGQPMLEYMRDLLRLAGAERVLVCAQRLRVPKVFGNPRDYV